jgi:nucleotide-binding universal stress UspA family protein
MLPIRTILHPTDFSERSGYAFELAYALARDYGARLIVLHVATPPTAAYGKPGPVPMEMEEYQRALKEKMRWLKVTDSKVKVISRLIEGDPVSEILRTVKEEKCELIVMGTHGQTGSLRLLMGSVADAVARRAPCSVLTLKEPFPEAAPEIRTVPLEGATV